MEKKMPYDFPASVHFHCTRCGICCGDTKEKTRHILLLPAEAEHIADSMSQPVSAFASEIKDKAPYCFEVRKSGRNGKCMFLAEDQCTIYSMRPLICRFYPFELRIAASQRHEFFCTKECPGVGKGRVLGEPYFRRLYRLAMEKTKAECETT